MKTAIIAILSLLSLNAEEFRTWTQQESSRTIVAKMTDKAADHSKAKVVTKKGKVHWLKSSSLIQEDQEYILNWSPAIDHLTCRVIKSSKGRKTIRVTVTTQQKEMELTVGPLYNGRFRKEAIGKDERWTQDVVCKSKYKATLTADGEIVDEEAWNRKKGL